MKVIQKKDSEDLREGPTIESSFHLECYVLDALQTKMENEYWNGTKSVPGPLLIDLMILGWSVHWWMQDSLFGQSIFRYYKYRGTINCRWPMPDIRIVENREPETFIEFNTGLLPGELNWVKYINWVPVAREMERISKGGSIAQFLAAQEIWERWSFDYYYKWPGRDRVYKDDLKELLKDEPGWD